MMKNILSSQRLRKMKRETKELGINQLKYGEGTIAMLTVKNFTLVSRGYL